MIYSVERYDAEYEQLSKCKFIKVISRFSNSGISKYSLIEEIIVWIDFTFSLYRKLLMSQSKFSGSRKFTLRYQ